MSATHVPPARQWLVSGDAPRGVTGLHDTQEGAMRAAQWFLRNFVCDNTRLSVREVRNGVASKELIPIWP